MVTELEWLVLFYKIPRQPTAGRVFVWRKLRKLGAILLHDSAWVLPANPQTREQLQWLAAEISELNGEATVFESHLPDVRREAALVAQFIAQADSAFGRIMTDLKSAEPDLPSLSRKFQQAHAQDYFRSEVGKKVRAELMAAREREEL